MTNKTKKRSSATTEKKAKSQPKPTPSVSREVPENADQEEASEEELGNSEDEGVDEEGMSRLMKALGEDGVDDFGKMHLEMLEQDAGSSSGDEEGTGEDEEEGEDSEESEDVEGGEENGKDYGSETGDEDEKSEKAVEGESDDEDAIALEDAESVDEDAIPRQKIVTNNKEALKRIRETIKLDPKLSWTETLAVTYSETISVDVEDDLNRELAFYKQALHGATTARKLAEQHNLPFTRPSDYFAEMVKSDAHMERIRQRLLDESAAIKKSEVKRKEREGKKFGKQLQIEKQKERERSKKEMEERLKGLKRKRGDVLKDPQTNDDAFDIAVEDAISERSSKRLKEGKSKMSRKGRDAKFGFGGKGRRSKQNTRESTEKFDFGNRKGADGKGRKLKKPNRPGKSRRMSARNR